MGSNPPNEKTRPDASALRPPDLWSRPGGERVCNRYCTSWVYTLSVTDVLPVRNLY